MSKVTVSQLADVLGVDSERLLAQLNDAGIEGVLTLVCHGDVGEQFTWMHTMWIERVRRGTEDNKTTCPKGHRHYRMVVLEVCLPLSDFHNGRELLQFFEQCIASEWHSNCYHQRRLIYM